MAERGVSKRGTPKLLTNRRTRVANCYDTNAQYALDAPAETTTPMQLAISLGVILVLDGLVMFFNDRILRTPGLLPVLRLLGGGVLIVVQFALAIDTMLVAFRELGVVTGV